VTICFSLVKRQEVCRRTHLYLFDCEYNVHHVAGLKHQFYIVYQCQKCPYTTTKGLVIIESLHFHSCLTNIQVTNSEC
jgi:hypothetical protein